MTWGPSLAFLKAQQDDGVDVPSLRNRPTLDPGLRYFQHAFMQISPGRRRNDQNFPFSLSLRDYLDYFEMFYVRTVTEREHHLKMFQALDEVYVRVIRDKMQQEVEAERRKNAT